MGLYNSIRDVLRFPGRNPVGQVDTRPLFDYFQPVLGGDVKKAVYTENWWLSPPYGRPRAIDYDELAPYADNIWVRMIINHIIASVCQTEIEIVDYNDEKPAAEGHIEEVSEFFTSRTWSESWKETMRRFLPDLLLYDAGVMIKTFPVINYDDNLQFDGAEGILPLELTARDGRSFLKETDVYGRVLRYYQYSWIAPSATPIAFHPDEIVYLSMNPMSASAYGKSNLQTIKDVVDYLSATTTAQRKMFENGLFPGGVINHGDVTDRAELKRNWQMYQAQLKGEKNFGKWMVSGGNTSVTPLQLSNQEMEWLDATKFFGKLVFAIFAITPTELGFTDDVNRSTALTQSRIYKTNGIQNILTVIEEYMNRMIVWRHFYDDVKFTFKKEFDLPDERSRADTDRVLAETRKIKLDMGIATINEFRIEDGLEPIEGDQYDKPSVATPEQKTNPWGNNPMPPELTKTGEGETDDEKTFEKSAEELGKIEDAAVKDLTRWGSKAQTLLEAALEEFYDEDGDAD